MKRNILICLLILSMLLMAGCIPEGFHLPGEVEEQVQEQFEGVQEAVGNMKQGAEEAPEIVKDTIDETQTDVGAFASYAVLIAELQDFAKNVDLNSYYNDPEPYIAAYPHCEDIASDETFDYAMAEDSTFRRVWSLLDLNDDGTDELIVGYETPGNYMVSVIYTYAEGKIVTVASSRRAAEGDPPLYTDIMICEGGELRVATHDQMQYAYYSVYEIYDEDPASLTVLLQYQYDPGDGGTGEDGVFYWALEDTNEQEEYTYDAFIQMLDEEYPVRDLYDLNWMEW